MSTTAVTNAVQRACLRAGLAPVRAHALRHALATELLRRGSSLVQISQVLRHRDLHHRRVRQSRLRLLAPSGPPMAWERAMTAWPATSTTTWPCAARSATSWTTRPPVASFCRLP